MVAISFFGRDTRHIRERLIPHPSRYCQLPPKYLAVFVCPARLGRAPILRPPALRAAVVLVRPPAPAAAVVARARRLRGCTTRALSRLLTPSVPSAPATGRVLSLYCPCAWGGAARRPFDVPHHDPYAPGPIRRFRPRF